MRGIPSSKALIECGKQFYERRWMWGTSGNLSLKIKQSPLKILITPSGINKGHLTEEHLLTLQDSVSYSNKGRNGLVPSSETVIHQAIHRALPECKAVFHVHPVYSTLISSFYGDPRKRKMLPVEWFEMMKGVGVGEEQSSEIAILPNWQDVSRIAQDVTQYLQDYKRKALPAVLIYNHGLTGWGETVDQARNHLEIIEYVCHYLYLKRLASK